ncbi:MAG: tetratricopeptide repeat protein [Deltaproteobacteria bacterium]|nr:tetratricopeptide repeat protein [Deltaproteobacteria bacterium]
MVQSHPAGEHVLKKAYPQVPAGEEVQALFNAAIGEMDRFAMLVIGVDGLAWPMGDPPERPDGESPLLQLARILNNMAASEDMRWGWIREALFACLCRDMDESAAVGLAGAVQQQFKNNTEHTLSVGVAVYPFWPFDKNAVLANAHKALDHASFFGPNTITAFDAVSLNISADKLYQYGDIDGAIEEFKKALMVDSRNVNVHNSLGVCYGVQKKFNLAIKAFETAISLDPGDVMATYNLGLAYLKQGNRDKALDLFLAAHRLDGTHPDIACHVGLCYQDKGEVERALSYLEPAARTAPNRATILRVLGDCYVHLDRLPEAVKAYEKAVKANPKDAKSLSALGQLYGRLGENLEVAIVLARESTVLDPENGLFLKRLAELYLKGGQPKEALKVVQEAEALGENCNEIRAAAREQDGAQAPDATDQRPVLRSGDGSP